MRKCVLETQFSYENYVAEFSCWEATDTNSCSLVTVCMVDPALASVSLKCPAITVKELKLSRSKSSAQLYGRVYRVPECSVCVVPPPAIPCCCLVFSCHC